MIRSASRTRLTGRPLWLPGLLVLTLIGCKGGESADGAASAPQAAAETAAPAAPADPAETAKAQLIAKLAGDWHMDLASLEKDPQFVQLPPQQRMQALAMARQMMADVTFSFSEEGQVRLGFGPTGRVGTYTVDKVDGTALHVTTKTKGPDGETVEKAILRIEGDAMWVTEGDDGRTIRLLRGKPEIAASQPTSQPTGAPASQPAGAPASQPARPASQPTRPASQPTGAPASQPKMPPPQPAQ